MAFVQSFDSSGDTDSKAFDANPVVGPKAGLQRHDQIEDPQLGGRQVPPFPQDENKKALSFNMGLGVVKFMLWSTMIKTENHYTRGRSSFKLMRQPKNKVASLRPVRFTGSDLIPLAYHKWQRKITMVQRVLPLNALT